MGSIAATIAAMEKAGTADRYAQETTERGKTVPEGVEGRVPYKGALGALVEQLVGGLRSGMGYCGVGEYSGAARARAIPANQLSRACAKAMCMMW